MTGQRQTCKVALWVSVLLLWTACGIVRADFIVDVQPILVHNTDGTGGATIPPVTFFNAETNKIWAQADTTINFLTPTNFNNSAFLNIVNSPNHQNLSDLINAPNNGKNPNPSVLDMWFVNSVQGAFGIAKLGSNGIAIAQNTFSFNGGYGRIDTIAHEIGHNLGLTHASAGGNPNNLMEAGGNRQVPRSIADIMPNGARDDQLTQAQIQTTRNSSLLLPFNRHQDVETHVVPGSIIPPIFGGTWSFDSTMNILSAEPHTMRIGSKTDFQFKETYNLSASSFNPLIVPGTPDAPASARDPLYNKTWTFDIKDTGPANFDYSTPWTFQIDPNMGGQTNPEFMLDLSKGPANVAVNWGGSTPATDFLFNPLPNDLRITFSTSDSGQGFFANGGSLSALGHLLAASPGNGMVFASNPHYDSGKGLFVNNYTMAEPDANGNPAIVNNGVFDTYTVTAPEPTTLTLFSLGFLCLLARVGRNRHWIAEDANTLTESSSAVT
jgi:hypothetical protein